MQKTARFSATYLLVALLFSTAAAPASAQSHPEYIPLGGGVKAVLYRPDSNPSPHVGVIIIHRTANYLQHQGCTQLSQRGFMVLCMNSRFDNNEALVDWELIALDVKRGVDYLRNTQHTNKVIFFGHSGGGPTTTFYQAVAEAGPSYCQGANKLTECDNSNNAYNGLTPADGLVLVDAHPGNTVNALRAINPAVSNENRPDLLQNKLDPIPRTVITPPVTRTIRRTFKRPTPGRKPSDTMTGLIALSISASKLNRANGSIQTMMTLPLGAAVARRPAEGRERICS